MMIYLTRAAWGARPSRGASPLVAAEVDGTALHWPGMAKSIDATGDAGKARVASALRGWQDYHMDVRGWSDIAYQVAVDQAGRAWTLRGLTTRSAANGDADVNSRYGALLLVLAPGETPSEAMEATVRGVIADFRRHFPAGTAIKPHSAVRPAGTDCPGDAARAAIARGDFTPRASTPAEEFTVSQYDDIMALLGKIDRDATNRYSDVANRVQAVLNEERARYGDFVSRFDAILADLVADPNNPFSAADAAEFREMAAVVDRIEAAVMVPKA